MDSRDIKSSASPSLSDPPLLNQSRQSFPYLTTTPAPAPTLSSLPSNHITPSTKLLPNAPHLTTQSQPHPLFPPPSQRNPHTRDNNMRIPTPNIPPHSTDSHQSHSQNLQPTQVHPHPPSSQSLSKLDPFSTSLSHSVMHLPPAPPLSSPSTQRYDLSSNHQQLVQEQQLRARQPPPYNSTSPQNHLPHLQTRPNVTSPLPTEPLPQITLPQSSRQISSSMDATPLRTVNPSMQGIPPQLPNPHIQPDSKNDPSQGLNRPSPPQKKSTLGSPTQTSRQHSRPHTQFGQLQQPMDRQRSLQARQPPPLPPRPAMLAPPRGSVVMQDVPRYQRQVVPSVSTHPSHTSQMHDSGSPGGNQQTAASVMQLDSMKQQDSNPDHQRHSMYHQGLISNARQMAPVPAMAQQTPASSTMAMGSGQHNSQAHPLNAHGHEHRHQQGSSEDRGNSSSFPRDHRKQDRSFSRASVADLRAPGQRASRQSPLGLHLDNPSRIAVRGDSDMFLSTSRRPGVDGSISPRYSGDKEQRSFDAESMTTPMREEDGQSVPKTRRGQDDLLSRSLDSSVPTSQQPNRQQRGLSGSVDGQASTQEQIGGEPRQQEFLTHADVTNRGMSGRKIEDFVSSSQVAGMRSPQDLLEHQTKLRDDDQLNKSSSPRRNRNDLSADLLQAHAIPPSSSQFSRSAHGRNMEPSFPRTVNQVMKAPQGADERRFQADDKEWQQAAAEREKASKSFSSNPPTGEPKDINRSTWRNDGRLVSGTNDASAKNQEQAQLLPPVSSHIQTVVETVTHVNPNVISGSRFPRPTNSDSRRSIDRHESPNFLSSPTETQNEAHQGVDDEKGADGVSGIAEGRELLQGQSTGVSNTDSKKKSGPKDGTMSQRQGTNRSTAAEDNDASQRKQLKVEDALAYLEKVKSQFSDQLNVYNQFLDIMKEFKGDRIDTNEVIRRVSTLFRGHKDLILGFNTFLPPGYKIRVVENAKTGILNTGFHGPAGFFNILPSHRKIASKTSGPRPATKKKGSAVSSPKEKDSKQLVNAPDGQVGPSASSIGVEQLGKGSSIAPTSVTAGKPATTGGIKSAPPRRHPIFDGGKLQSSRTLHPSVSKVGGESRTHEFERAIGFVTAIKERFADSPDTFNEFLDALRRFREEQKSIREVFEAVADLFGPHKDLLSQFKEFIPAISCCGIQDTKTIRDRGPSQVSRRNQASKVISESTPSRRPGALNGKMKPRHRIREMQFFEDLKAQLGPSKAHLYTEFIKCLSLFSQGIVSREELLHLTGEILQDDQDAHASFLDYLGVMANTGEDGFEGEHHFSSSISSDGEPTAVDVARIAYYTSKPMSEIASEAGTEQMHSYRRVPHDFPPYEYSGRSLQEKRTLNDTWVNVTTGSEDYSFKFMRRNQSEDNLFRCEDDRYELDLVIETNAAAIMKLETIVGTMSKLPLGEKKRHALASGALTPIHFNAIQRIYGESGAEVISQLKMNPAVAVPVILKRLKEKDVTWRRARMEMNKVWREVGERNFHKSLDHRSSHFKAVDKKDLSAKSLLTDITDPAASVAARETEMTRARGYPVQNGGGGANHRSQALKAVLAAAQFASDKSSRRLELKFEDFDIHRLVYKLIFDVVDDEASKKSVVQFGELIQSFFGVSFGEKRTVRQNLNERGKSNVTILYGDDTVYLAFRLYHLLFERISLAFELAQEQVADRERRMKLNEEGHRRLANRRGQVSIETKPSQLTKGMNSSDVDSKFSLGPVTENLEEICEQFLEMATQFARTKLDWSRYEDKCRTLLGVDSYALFTIDKTAQKLIKAIETMFSADSPTRGFCELFHECQQRLADSRMNGGRLDTEGIEVLYSVTASQHLAEMRGAGANLMRFQSSCEDKQVTTLIHVIGQTNDEDLTRILQAKRTVLDKFLQFCGSYGDCNADVAADVDGKNALNDRRSVGSGGNSNGGDGVTSKRARRFGSQGRRSRGAGLDFLRYRLDDEKKVGESLMSGALMVNNGLEWQLDGNGVMRFAAGTSDFLFNTRRKRPWDEGLIMHVVNENCKSKRRRRVLRMDEKRDEPDQAVVQAPRRTETENEADQSHDNPNKDVVMTS